MANKYEITLNWRRAAADVLLIVIGVSIALAADSWLAERVEKVRIDRLLDSLEVEWAAELNRLDAHVDKLEAAKAAKIRLIRANKDNSPSLTAEGAASLLLNSYKWSTFKPSEGALNALLVDGLQNIDDTSLRLAVSSWRNVLAEVVAEQAALRELGTLIGPRISARIAQKSSKENSYETREYSNDEYGMGPGDFALAAIADDEWVANERHVLDLLTRYQTQLEFVRKTLEQNLTLLRER
jgi:hypothetical protein